MLKELEKIWETVPSNGQFMTLFGGVSKAILEIYDRIEQGTVYKSDDSPQTLADRLSDEMIGRYLRLNSPFPVLSEEQEDTGIEYPELFWIVDPLDGTRDFLNKTGEFSIMAALVRGHQPIFGAVYRPLTRSCYIARVEEGALLLGDDGSSTRLHVSDVSDPANMRMMTSRIFTKGTDIAVAKALGICDENLIFHGSFGLKACRVAEGGAELFLSSSSKTSIWDSAPALVIVPEAGGKMTDLNGQNLAVNPADRRNRNGVIVTNGQNHSQLAHRIKEIVNQIRVERG